MASQGALGTSSAGWNLEGREAAAGQEFIEIGISGVIKIHRTFLI